MVLCQRLKDALKGLGVIKQTGQHPPSSIFKQISSVNRPTSLPDFHPHPQIPKFSITDYPHTSVSLKKCVSRITLSAKLVCQGLPHPGLLSIILKQLNSSLRALQETSQTSRHTHRVNKTQDKFKKLCVSLYHTSINAEENTELTPQPPIQMGQFCGMLSAQTLQAMEALQDCLFFSPNPQT